LRVQHRPKSLKREVGKKQRKDHKGKREDRYGTFCDLNETLASSAFVSVTISPANKFHPQS